MSDIGPSQYSLPELLQARAAEAFQIVLPVGFPLHRHLVCDPGERKYWAVRDEAPAKRPWRHRSGRPCRRRRSARGGRRRNRCVAGSPRVTAASPCHNGGRRTGRRRQCRNRPPKTDRAGSAATRGGGLFGVLPAAAISQRQAIIALGQREVRIEPQRQFELGKRIVEAASEHINAAQRKVRPGILAIGADRGQRSAFGDRRGRRRPPSPCER